MDKKIKILLFIDEASMGGGQKHLLLLAKYLNKSEFEVEVACEAEGFLVDELHKLKIPIHPVNITNKPSIKALLNIQKLIKAINPDVIHSHGGTAGFYSRITSLLGYKGKTVHTYHGIHYLNFPRPFPKIFFRLIDKYLLRFTDKIICVAQNDFELGLKNGVVAKDKSVVIKNGIEIEPFSSSINRKETTNSFIIGSVGRLHHQKGYEFLIMAAPEIIKKFPEVKFIIAGDGELKEKLIALTEQYNVKNFFSFLGNRDDIPNVLNQMDIFVLPSLWEGLPLVLLEAMAAKKPIVATKVNGVSEILENEVTGLLIPPANHELLGNAIIRLLEDEKLRNSFSENVYSKVVSNFDVSIMVKRTEELYKELLRKS